MIIKLLVGRFLSSLFLVIGALAILLPFIWMLSLAFKPQNEIFTDTIQLLPTRIEWGNFVKAITETDVPLYLMNGAIVVIGILVFQLLFAVPCAYALVQRNFKARTFIFGMVLAALLVPFHVTAIPIFLGFAQIGILNTYWALILPFVPTAFGIFLFRQFLAQVPADLFEAARVDGLSETAIVWRIAFPLAMPAATAFAIFSITAHWNDLFWPLIATTDPNLATPPRGILFFRDEESGDDVGPLMAAATLITAPLVIAFLFAQRKFTQGLASGGLKG
ncbi:carbohydrate ABC transporter permease [uncultured Roseibium sp.]|uniref:carbohydrate ABC transporter permease n=1 Tax=uncultured Roseibium sp. TaxID=1936171 RepID=UPI00260F60AF|nr:carbohydrate ABC transporter permease [uncultured Roseibium sp.]